MLQVSVPTAALNAKEILAHLEDVLASPPFRASRRSRQFLEYVVTTTLDAHIELLKERLIGERIFGRAADYDTGQDSIVRVKANEVRRRLAQYYDLNPTAPLRIDLPAGSYVVQFQLTPQAPEISEPPPRRSWPARRTLLVAAVTIAAVLLAIRAVVIPSPFHAFWRPFLKAPGDLLICIPSPETYRIYGTDKQKLISALAPRPPTQPAPLLHPDQIDDVEIVSEPGMFVGLGDARTMTLLYALASGSGKPPKIRTSTATTFTELRAGPSILVGGFTNSWTLDLTKDHRFVFYQENGQSGIRDGQTGKPLCVKQRNWETGNTEDCALITRLTNAKTGQPLLVAAGLNHFGTFAVGEFLTRPDLLEAALRSAPEWSTRNLQIVFRVEIVHDNIGPPKVIAVHTW